MVLVNPHNGERGGGLGRTDIKNLIQIDQGPRQPDSLTHFLGQDDQIEAI